MTRRVLGLIAVVLLVGSATHAQSPQRFRVFVTVPEVNGLLAATKESDEGLRDLTDALKKENKTFEIASAASRADIVLMFVDRSMKTTRSGSIMVPIAGMLVAAPLENRQFTILSDVQVGGRSRRSLMGLSSKNHKDGAKSLVADLKAWSIANAEQIRAMASETRY